MILEANHDPELLLNGPYPLPLKQRIRSRHGHLSNAETFELLQTLHHNDLQIVLFAHLSEVNNQPELVLGGCRAFLNGSGWDSVTLEVGKQHEVSKAFALR